jgi:3-mercaptopyruvate sulfurtransferase SseA
VRGQVDVDALTSMIATERDHIDARDLAQWIKIRKPGLRVIDLRAAEAFSADHIPTAENLPLEKLGHAGFSPTDTVVLYSQGGAHAAQAWVLLRALGLHQVYFLSGGFDEWTGAPAGSNARTSVWRRGC